MKKSQEIIKSLSSRTKKYVTCKISEDEFWEVTQACYDIKGIISGDMVWGDGGETIIMYYLLKNSKIDKYEIIVLKCLLKKHLLKFIRRRYEKN